MSNYVGMEIPVDIDVRREILAQMLEFSSFGADDKEANLNWLVEDINHLIKGIGMSKQLKLIEPDSQMG